MRGASKRVQALSRPMVDATNQMPWRQIVAEKSPPSRAFFGSRSYLFDSTKKYLYFDAADFVFLAPTLSSTHRKISPLKLQSPSYTKLQVETVPQLTVRQAAERVGISRQTMFRYIKEGRVSATLSHAGEKQIEISELLRAFGALQPETAPHATNRVNQRQSHNLTETQASVTYQIELERLRAQLELKNAELELAKERIAELKNREHTATEEKNRLLTLVEQQTRLLTAPTPKKKASAPTQKAATRAPIPAITAKKKTDKKRK